MHKNTKIRKLISSSKKKKRKEKKKKKEKKHAGGQRFVEGSPRSLARTKKKKNHHYCVFLPFVTYLCPFIVGEAVIRKRVLPDTDVACCRCRFKTWAHTQKQQPHVTSDNAASVQPRVTSSHATSVQPRVASSNAASVQPRVTSSHATSVQPRVTSSHAASRQPLIEAATSYDVKCPTRRFIVSVVWYVCFALGFVIVLVFQGLKFW